MPTQFFCKENERRPGRHDSETDGSKGAAAARRAGPGGGPRQRGPGQRRRSGAPCKVLLGYSLQGSGSNRTRPVRARERRTQPRLLVWPAGARWCQPPDRKCARGFDVNSRLGHLPRGGVRGAGRTSPWRCPEAAGHAGVGSGGWVRGAGTGVWPRPGSRYAAGAASGPQKGQEDDGEQGGGRQSKASVAGAARTARRPSDSAVRPSRLGESGFCAGDGSRRSGDGKRSRRFPGVWLGRGERGDGMTPG